MSARPINPPRNPENVQRDVTHESYANHTRFEGTQNPLTFINKGHASRVNTYSSKTVQMRQIQGQDPDPISINREAVRSNSNAPAPSS